MLARRAAGGHGIGSRASPVSLPGEGDGQQGAALVEFAVVLPVLIVLVLGMIEFGIAFNTQISLTGAAREGARIMAIHNDASAATAATVDSAAMNPPPAVVVTPSPCTRGDEVTVTASRAVQISVPFVGNPTLDLAGVAVMRCGG